MSARVQGGAREGRVSRQQVSAPVMQARPTGRQLYGQATQAGNVGRWTGRQGGKQAGDAGGRAVCGRAGGRET